MNFVICEDNRQESEWLQERIIAWARSEGIPALVTAYDSAEKFWFSYEDGIEMDALLLDIQMPGESGIELAKRLRGRQDRTPVLFITGIDDYMAEGYDVQAVHYLLKPVQQEKLEKCLEQVRRMQEKEEPSLLLQLEDGTVRLWQKDILKVEIFAHICIFTTPSKTYTTATSLRKVKEQLYPRWFVHSHRSILINLLHVESITHTKVFLTGGHEAEVSRRMYKELNQAFIDFFSKTSTQGIKKL